MKTIAIIFAVLLSACVTDEPCDEPAPITYPPATYCAMHFDDVQPSTGFLPGPCVVTVTIEMLCSEPDDVGQAFDGMLVYWETRHPGPTNPIYNTGFVGTTYRCNQAQTIQMFGAECTGSPYTVAAGFEHPTLGTYSTDNGSFLCADSRSVTQ